MFRQLFGDLRKFLSNPQQIVDEPQFRRFRTWLTVLAVDIAITAAIIIPLIYLIDEYILHLRPIPVISKPMTFIIFIAGQGLSLPWIVWKLSGPIHQTAGKQHGSTR